MVVGILTTYFVTSIGQQARNAWDRVPAPCTAKSACPSSSRWQRRCWGNCSGFDIAEGTLSADSVGESARDRRCLAR